MRIPSTILAVLISIAVASAFVSYMSNGTSQTVVASSSSDQQKQIAELKRQIAGLQEKINWLEERFTEPQRQKPSQF